MMSFSQLTIHCCPCGQRFLVNAVQIRRGARIERTPGTLTATGIAAVDQVDVARPLARRAGKAMARRTPAAGAVAGEERTRRQGSVWHVLERDPGGFGGPGKSTWS